MNKTIMHKDDEVAIFSCSSNGSYKSLVEVIREDLLPDRTREYDTATKRWLLTRKPSSRISEFSEIKRFYGPEFFTSKNYRSMNDCYWIRGDENEEETWQDVNPFLTWDPTFDSLFMMTYKPADFDGIDESSPNLTLTGSLPLFWYEIDGKLVLINERAQSDMMYYKEALKRGFNFVEKREYKIIAGRVFSFRNTAVSEDVERISFDLYYNMMEDKNLSKSENIANCCNNLGIANWKEFISEMIELDKVCGRSGRDLCDIGVLRNANTLECIGFDKL